MSNLPHAVAHCIPTIQTVSVGVTYMTCAITAAVTAAVGFGLGWYIKGRGMAGVEIDINNIKTDILNLKNKIDPSAPAPISATV